MDIIPGAGLVLNMGCRVAYNAVLYSLVQTCLANGIDPYKYLVTVIERFPAARTSDDVRALLPWALKSELLPDVAPLKLAA